MYIGRGLHAHLWAHHGAARRDPARSFGPELQGPRLRLTSTGARWSSWRADPGVTRAGDPAARPETIRRWQRRPPVRNPRSRPCSWARGPALEMRGDRVSEGGPRRPARVPVSAVRRRSKCRTTLFPSRSRAPTRSVTNRADRGARSMVRQPITTAVETGAFPGPSVVVRELDGRPADGNVHAGEVRGGHRRSRRGGPRGPSRRCPRRSPAGSGAARCPRRWLPT